MARILWRSAEKRQSLSLSRGKVYNRNMETRKPNHSNDGELQPINPDGTYAPKDGTNVVDAALDEDSASKDEVSEAPGIKGDFSKLNLGGRMAKYVEDAKALENISEDDKKLLEAMSSILVKNKDKRGFLDCLHSLPEKMAEGYRRVILGHDHVPPVKINVTGIDRHGKNMSSHCYDYTSHEVIFLEDEYSECGPSLDTGCHNPWETFFHELGHALDATANIKYLNFGMTPLSCCGSGDGNLYLNLVDDVGSSGGIDEFSKAVADCLNQEIKDQIAKSGPPKTIEEAIKMVDKTGGKMSPLMDFLTAYNGGSHAWVNLGNWFVDYIKSRKITFNMSQMCQLTMLQIGHPKSYWDRRGRSNAGSRELFAELLALRATDKEVYKKVAKTIPIAVKRFEAMFGIDSDDGDEEEKKGGE